MSEEFTPRARVAWEKIPASNRFRLLNNVWCLECSAVRTIVRFKGRVEGGDLVLEGECGSCGGSVARLIEQD